MYCTPPFEELNASLIVPNLSAVSDIPVVLEGGKRPGPSPRSIWGTSTDLPDLMGETASAAANRSNVVPSFLL